MKQCGSCFGNGKVSCYSCGGTGTISRFGIDGVEINSCLVCGGSRRMNCTFCGGSGQVGTVSYGRSPAAVEGPEKYYRQGMELWQDGEFSDPELAFDCFNKAIQLDPDNANSYCNRGLAQFQRGKLQAAISDYGHAIKLNRNDAISYCNRGNVYHALKQNDKASRDWQKASDLGNAQASFNLLTTD